MRKIVPKLQLLNSQVDVFLHACTFWQTNVCPQHKLFWALERVLVILKEGVFGSSLALRHAGPMPGRMHQ